MRILAFVVALLLSAVHLNADAAAGGGRVALVIGNGDYAANADMPSLPNPSNDAEAVAGKLRALDFDVIEVRDGTYRAMIDGLRQFSREASGADIALFYYAGHGLQADGENYLMPVDAKIEIAADLDYESLLVSRVREELQRANADVSLVILDACRNNPLSRSLARNAKVLGRSVSTGEGLARMSGATGMLIAYATGPDNVAFDGQGDNSPFTSALLEHLNDPVDARIMFARVRAKVVDLTNGAQTPWVEEAVIGEFSIAGLSPERGEDVPTNRPLRTQRPSGAMAEVAFWNSIVESDDPEEIRAYLEQYPEGQFAALANRRIDNLIDQQRVSPLEAEKRLDISRTMLRAVQTRLDEAGHDPGMADGLMGSRTRGAIQEFERAQGLPADGYLDQELLAALGSAASGIPLEAVETRVRRRNEKVEVVRTCEGDVTKKETGVGVYRQAQSEFIRRAGQSLWTEMQSYPLFDEVDVAVFSPCYQSGYDSPDLNYQVTHVEPIAFVIEKRLAHIEIVDVQVLQESGSLKYRFRVPKRANVVLFQGSLSHLGAFDNSSHYFQGTYEAVDISPSNDDEILVWSALEEFKIEL